MQFMTSLVVVSNRIEVTEEAGVPLIVSNRIEAAEETGVPQLRGGGGDGGDCCDIHSKIKYELAT